MVITAATVQNVINMRGLVTLPFHPTHMNRVVLNAVDRRIFECLPDWDLRLEALHQQKCAWTLFYEKEPALVMGLEYKFPAVYEAWLIPGEKCYEHGALLSRGARRFFDRIQTRLNLRRIQIVVNVHHETAIRWAEFLKFTREGRMTKYGPEGDDYYMYARIY